MKRSIVVVLLIVASTVAWAAEENGRPVVALVDAGRVRGAWQAVHTPGEGGPPPFSMLMVLTRDGGVVETDAGPPNPLQFSPGIGEWERNEDGTYTIQYTQIQYDDGQNQIGVFRGRLDVAFDFAKATFSGKTRVQFYDTTETLLFEGEGTVEGKRLSK